MRTGVDGKVPSLSAPHRDMELKVPTKPGRRAMAPKWIEQAFSSLSEYPQ